jgi:hypothetical protein
MALLIHIIAFLLGATAIFVYASPVPAPNAEAAACVELK